MIILLVSGLREKLVVEPDPAVVDRGSNIEWELSFNNAEGLETIRWEIYFRKSSPFKENFWKYVTKSATEPSGQKKHRGVIRAGSADEPGEHKYGVRIIDTNSEKALSDDDPWIIVRG